MTGGEKGPEHGSGVGGGKNGAVAKVVLKKRKKRLRMSCDKLCEACRIPCDTPFRPQDK